jgi:hypothetical protein
MFHTLLFLNIIVLFNNTQEQSSSVNSNGYSSNDTIYLKENEIEFIKFKCEGRPSKPKKSRSSSSVFKNEKDFKEYYTNCAPLTPIDFEKRTFLRLVTQGGGCEEPHYIRTVKIINKKVIFHVHVIQKGNCLALNLQAHNITIPKLDPDITVEFKVTREIKNNKY